VIRLAVTVATAVAVVWFATSFEPTELRRGRGRLTGWAQEIRRGLETLTADPPPPGSSPEIVEPKPEPTPAAPQPREGATATAHPAPFVDSSAPVPAPAADEPRNPAPPENTSSTATRLTPEAAEMIRCRLDRVMGLVAGDRW
jgi:hypothetical protein